MTWDEIQSAALDEIPMAIAEGAKGICLTGPTGCGKCLGEGTPVLMFDGSILSVEDVEVGDVLMGPDSCPRYVVSCCTGEDDLYRVIPKRYGEPVVITSDHVLSLQMTGGSKRGCGCDDFSIVNIPLTEYFERSNTFRHCAKLYHVGIDFPDSDVPIDPYFLGLWLGDGSSKNQAITTADFEVVEAIRNFANREGLRVVCHTKDGNKASTYALSGTKWKSNCLRDALRELGVFGNKHVPMCYKANSTDTRLNLLAGIIDSDGHYRNGCFDLVFKSMYLADDVAYLARSLGLSSSLRVCQKECTNTGQRGLYWRVSVVGNTSVIPTRILRKQAVTRRQIKNHLMSQFDIEAIGKGSYFGFTLAPDGLFLLGDFSVTHNSIMMATQAERAKRVAIYTHRKMLFDQLSSVLDRHGVDHGKRAAGYEKRLLDDVQLCMIQSETSWDRGVHECDQFHVDEIHVNAGASMQELMRQHHEQGAVGIYWTATPLGIGHVADKLIVIATTSELRKCGALVPAYHYGPDEPDIKWIKNIKIDEGECGIPLAKRGIFAKRVFGRVVEHYHRLNPDGLPTVLFAPGVKESIWFAEQLTTAGIPTAHIDGQNVWLDGEELPSTTELREEIRDRCQSGSIKIVSNRFVLREGIDWPWLEHGILATVFGSLTSYIQACGRLLRAAPNKDRCTIQDHGGNWWRHGSINSDWKWELDDTNRTKSGERVRRLREKKEPEPIVCPECFACRLGGPECFACGYRHMTRSRPVLQKDGTLREMYGDIYRKPRRAQHNSGVARQWTSRVRAICRSEKDTVKWMTAAQLEANLARENYWVYPPLGLEFMPANDADWFRPLRSLYPELVPIVSAVDLADAPF